MPLRIALSEQIRLLVTRSGTDTVALRAAETATVLRQVRPSDLLTIHLQAVPSGLLAKLAADQVVVALPPSDALQTAWWLDETVTVRVARS